MTEPKYAISIRGIKKIYAATGSIAEKHALKGFDLDVPTGSMFALLGPNGAGKSTLINIISGMVDKTSGRINIWDFDIDTQQRNAKGAVGIVPQELNIDPFFSPIELLELHAGLYGIPKSKRHTEKILRTVGLWEQRGIYSRKMSGGMRRRLLIAKAMVHSPPILILDEPTAGVDVELRQQLWENIRALNAQGTTILLTTHYLEEAEELCDYIAVLNEGKLVANDRKKHLLQFVDKKILEITFTEDGEKIPSLIKDLETQKNVECRLLQSNTIEIGFSPSKTLTADILDFIKQRNLTIKDITSKEAHLKDIFLQLTSKKNVEQKP